jgi:hypothetical protein
VVKEKHIVPEHGTPAHLSPGKLTEIHLSFIFQPEFVILPAVEVA